MKCTTNSMLMTIVATMLSATQIQAQTPSTTPASVSPASVAAKFEMECPEEIRTKQLPAAPVKGWSAHVEVLNSRQIFTGLTLTEGHPKDGVQLNALEVGDGGGATSENRFELPKGRDVFMVCEYGNTLVRLIQKLPKNLTSCRVKYSATLGHVQKAVCD